MKRNHARQALNDKIHAFFFSLLLQSSFMFLFKFLLLMFMFIMHFVSLWYIFVYWLCSSFCLTAYQ